MIKREITWAPGFFIDVSGQVFEGKNRLTPEVRQNRFSKHLTVWINDRCEPVISLLRFQVHNGDFVLSRNGNPLSVSGPNSNYIVVPHKRLAGEDNDLVTRIWELYRMERLPVSQIRSKGGLQNHCTEFFVSNVVEEILQASIRL